MVVQKYASMQVCKYDIMMHFKYGLVGHKKSELGNNSRNIQMISQQILLTWERLWSKVGHRCIFCKILGFQITYSKMEQKGVRIPTFLDCSCS